MRTVSTKLTREELTQFKEFCNEQISTPSQVLRHLVRNYLAEKTVTN